MSIKFKKILTSTTVIILTILASTVKPIITSNLLPPANAQVQPKTASTLPQYCAPDEYKAFFENFVRGQDYQRNEIRLTYTADIIEVRDYENPSYLIGTLNKKDDEFSINLRDYRWVQLVPSTIDNSPYTRLNIDLIRMNNNTFRVNYIKAHYAYDPKGEGEEYLDYTYGKPGAYIFEHRNGCWNLTQKLR
ncbi:hypothetical protein [Planktothrix agardhii]|jgi:hypothetical protein|uniref:hypothetical protein n=1 Tax=Planktothrix agardhii TaxID=1160 RepID=UPI000DBB8B35|nr:hypothetical protein [Planktothrix agardhii]BBD54466.1 hypothetical protein NIES204_17600 [Planktothrix agardhii NIES-204]MCB8761645.1 hypothetical protein [Planktothrix agardhii 1813]MCB8784938.1 hypothetical protein [Planktothrix agardhii 1025]MCF3578615.1 hypothetical protein [Planktothrix agardhii 1812]MCF3614096.1 hypothetical protein [Planktothrix agardhii 1027]